MNKETDSTSLVERKKFDDKKAHAITRDIWWVGFIDARAACSFNPYLLIDGNEVILINPGPRADAHHKLIHKKISSIINMKSIQHIVLLHDDPVRCAGAPLFESQADSNVRIYAPSRVADSIKYYGCKHPVIGLDGGDSIIMKSGRTINYYETPDLPCSGSGFLHDPVSGTIFSGTIFNCSSDDWNLYASSDNWDNKSVSPAYEIKSKKAFHKALNKIERLSPERICPQKGPIIEEDIDKYIETARNLDLCE
jgi:flavorubredoxin